MDSPPLLGDGFGAAGVAVTRVTRRLSDATDDLSFAMLGVVGSLVINAVTATTMLGRVLIAIIAGIFACIQETHRDLPISQSWNVDGAVTTLLRQARA